MILHLETHCSIKNQQKLVQILKYILGSKLYIPPQRDKFTCTDLTPEILKGKVMISVSILSRNSQNNHIDFRA